MSVMINNLLDRTGLPYRRARFPSPPRGSYIVYTDDVSTNGPDGVVALLEHSITLELYESNPDDGAETKVEQALYSAALQWVKQDRYWLQDEQRYQVVYEFSFNEKRRF